MTVVYIGGPWDLHRVAVPEPADGLMPPERIVFVFEPSRKINASEPQVFDGGVIKHRYERWPVPNLERGYLNQWLYLYTGVVN